MPYVITDRCMGERYADCVGVCPVSCIYPGDYAGEEFMVIDPDVCIDCGLCVDECPVKAIFPEDDLPAQWKNYVEINVAYYKK